jgi:predicted phage tail protein
MSEVKSMTRTLEPVPISGAKKGGGGGGTESKDTLRSTQTAAVLDLVSEGPCIGLVNDLKSIYLDGVPVVAQTGEANIEGVRAEWTSGLISQPAIDDMDGVQAEVGVKVTAATPLVRSVTAATSASKLRVTLGIPQLTKQDTSSGDLNGSSVQVAIDLQTNGGGYVQVAARTVDGKCTSRYQFAFLIDLSGAGPWDLRVRRVTPDSTSVTLQDEVWWDSYTLITSLSLRYPCSSLVGLKVGAEKFSSIPRRSYDWMGLVVSVPSNYDPYSRNYTGTWDGTFKEAWTNNPAWVFFDVATKKRYGAGRRISTALLNKWTLYQIGRYCDAVNTSGTYVGVPDGRGGVEPRFTCNAWITEQKEAYTLLQELAALMRGCVSWWGGSVDLMQDAPSDAVMLYTPANVVGGSFRYEGTSKGLKKSGCIVWWNDPTNFGKATPELYQDPELVARYGVETMTLRSLGCTSRGQAARMAKWAVYSEAHEGMVVRFAVGSEGALSGLGRIIQTSDPIVSGDRAGGRVIAMTATTVRLDKAVTLAAGTVYTLALMVPDATDPFKISAVDRTVTTGAGTTDTLTLSGGVPAGATLGGVWILKSPSLYPQTWRVLSVSEGAPTKEGGQTYEIAAVAHNPSKWGYIEQGLKLESRVVSRVSLTAAAPMNLVCKETIVTVAGQVSSTATLSWTPGAPGQRYEVSWRHRLGIWNVQAETSANTCDITGLTAGRLDVSVRAVNVIGNRSTALLPSGAGYYLLVGKDAPPSNVANFGVAVASGQAAFTWGYPEDSDYDVTEIRMVADGGTWATTPLAFRFKGRADHCPIAPYPAVGIYAAFAAHWDTSGNQSLTPQGITVTVTASGITASASGTNLVMNSGFKVLRSPPQFPPAPYEAAGWNLYAWGYTLAGAWAHEDRPGRDGTGRSYALRTVAAAAAGTQFSRMGFTTGASIMDGMVRGGVSGGWRAGQAYTVSLWARMWSPGGGAAAVATNAISAVGSTTGSVLQTGSYTVALPAGTQAGDLLMLFVHAGASTTSINWAGAQTLEPGGSTTGFLDAAASANRRIAARYRAATAADITAGTISIAMAQNSTGSTQTFVLTAYRGVDMAAPVIASQWSTKASSTVDPAFPALALGGVMAALPVHVFVPGNTASATGSVVWGGGATATAGIDWVSAGGVWVSRGTQAAMSETPAPTCDYSATAAFVSNHLVLALRPGTTVSGSDRLWPGLYTAQNTLLAASDRSYMLARIDRASRAVTFTRVYDVWGVGAGGAGIGNTAATLAADLNASTPDSIVVVWTADSPLDHRTDSGLAAALYRCGASPEVFTSDQWQTRCAYQLIGIPEAGPGTGYERYKGAKPQDPTALIDTRFAVVNGSPVIGGTGPGAYRVISAGYGLTAAADPTEIASPWEGLQTSLYWNRPPAEFTKVQCPGISSVRQQYKFAFRFGAVVEPEGNLYWGIGDETGATVLPEIPLSKVGTVLEIDDVMVCEGAEFPPHEDAPQDDLRTNSIATEALLENATFNDGQVYNSGPWTGSDATVLAFQIAVMTESVLKVTMEIDGRITSLATRPNSAL